MLLELAQYLDQYVRAFNVFTYITLRVVLAAYESASKGKMVTVK